MKKRILCLLLLACGLVGCGESTMPTQEVDYTMTFANQTGQDVSKVEIRPSADSEWSEITLSEAEWRDSYEMPVSMQGQIPLAAEGWQVQMTFGEEEQKRIWEGVHFGDEVTLTFTMEDGETQVIASEPAKEVPAADRAAEEDATIDGTTAPAEEDTED